MSTVERPHVPAEFFGRTIKDIVLADNALDIRTESGTLRVYDDARYCCEERFLTCDDDLSAFHGARFMGLEVKGVNIRDEEGMVHEVCFLDVKTSNGVFTIAAHNRHNGYYGGFNVRLDVFLET